MKPVDPARIEHELNALWLAQAQPDQTRTRLLNFIVFADDPPAAQTVLADLLAREPFRAILITTTPTGEGLTAEVALTPTGGEQITLVAHGPSSLDLPSTVLSLLLTDLPVFLWWQSGDPFAHPIFEHLTRAVDRVLLDSLTLADSSAALADIAHALGDAAFPSVIIDLGWTRLSPWRVLTAQIFDPPALRPHLAQIEHIRLTHATGSANLVRLFGAWLASRLDWQLTSQTPDQLRFADGQTIELISAPAPAVAPGYFLGLHLHTRDGDTFEVTRLPNACAATRLTLAGQVTERIAPVQYASLTDWIGRELNRPSRTPLFEAAVQLLAQSRAAPAQYHGPM